MSDQRLTGSTQRKQRIFSLYARGEISLSEVSRRIGEIRPGPATRTWFVEIVKALTSWWYWTATPEGSTRRREAHLLDDAMRLVEPNYREMMERLYKQNIMRPDSWWDVPRRWRR